VISGGGNRSTWALNLTTAAVLPTPTTVVVPPATQLSFLGYGLLYPFQRGAGNDFVAAFGVDLVKARLKNILGTKAGTQGRAGELPWRGEFGCRAHLLRHRTKTTILGKMAQQYVLEAFAQWEPCARVAFATVKKTPTQPRNLTLRVVYDIVPTNPAGNQVVTPDQSLEVPLSASAG
jgi:hypothetical protein